MRKYLFNIVYIIIALTNSGLGQEKWIPPEAPDLVSGTPIEYLKRAVVYIYAGWTEAQNEVHREIGAGIALGFNRGQMHVITAAHVVFNKQYGGFADVIKVSVKRSPNEFYYLIPIKHDDQKDFAVLKTSIYNEADKESVVRIPVDYHYDYSAGKNVKVIGHPGFFDWQDTVTKTLVSNNNYMMMMERRSIDNGNSGGPVLSKSHRLIGMVTAVQGDLAYAIRITEIKKLLDQWDIPYKTRLTSNIDKNFKLIMDAFYNGDRDEKLLGDKIYMEYSLGDFFHSKVALFNKELAAIVKETDTHNVYFVELLGDYTLDNKNTLDEAWRIIVRNIGMLIPSGYTVVTREHSILFRKFELFHGTVCVIIQEYYNEIYLVVGNGIGEGIGQGFNVYKRLDHTNITQYLRDKFQEIENK